MTRPYASLLTWCALALASSLMLYHTSDRVHALDQRLHALEGQIDAEKQSMHVLRAEWVYLANPGRLASAAQRHLPLLPTATARVVAMNDLGTLLPVQAGDANTALAAASPKDGDAGATAVATVAPASVTPSTGHLTTTHASVALGGGLTSHALHLRGLPAHSAAVATAEVPGFAGVLSDLSLRQ